MSQVSPVPLIRMVVTSSPLSKSVLPLGVILILVGAQADPLPPAPPLALIAESADSGVELSWLASGPADLYVVYRAESWEAVVEDQWDAFEAVGQTPDLTFLYEPEGPQTQAAATATGVFYVTAVLGEAESTASNLASNYPYCLNIDTDCFLPPPIWPPWS